MLSNLFSGTDKSRLKEVLKGKPVLVDVRSPEEFATGSAPGAVNYPLNELPHKLDSLRGHEAIVVFCRSGNRSAQAKKILEQAGITPVINGGTWQDVTKAVKELKP